VVGTYTVSLPVSDGTMEDTEVKVDYITVDPIVGPVAGFSGSPTGGIEPVTVSFTDESTQGSYPLASWFWDFGDGNTSTEQNPAHEYANAGVYTVSLTVSDGNLEDTETKVDYITVNPAISPEAGFSGLPTSGYAPLTVNFTDESTFGLPIISWDWDFGDGGISSEQNPQHVYETPGIYDVSLTIFDGTFTDTETKTAYITVNSLVGPVAGFSADPLGGTAPLEISFSDESVQGTYPILNWDWDFGDGNTATGQNPVHVYETTGVYTVSLTIDDGTFTDTETKVGYIDVITGFDEFSAGGKAYVYPNPFSEKFFVSNTKGITKIEVFDLHGTIIKSFAPTAKDLKIEMGTSPAGIYYIVLHTENGTVGHKLLKK
jgi:PKD repeat protein